MGSSDTTKEEIKRLADIVEIVGEVVDLKRAGHNYVGLCPFHGEKDPSFTVNPERQTFHCFGCKKGGDVFSFWMDYHGVTFPEALQDLARRYGVTLARGAASEKDLARSRRRRALFEMNKAALAYFQESLAHPAAGKAAREYLERRALGEEIIREFGLGYAPDSWHGFEGRVRKESLDPAVAAAAGLLVARQGGGTYDRFRGRIMFPIFDLRGNVVGFGGRVLDDSLPKYLNTPETEVFVKGDLLYGLHAAHRAIRDSGRSIVVEGYMDCLGLRRHGVREAIATLGTALTERQVRRIKGYGPEAVVVFDADTAGKKAAMRSLPLFLKEGVSARAAVLPDGEDPDSFVGRWGAQAFLDRIDKAPPLFEFFMEEVVRSHASDPEGKRRALNVLLPVLEGLSENHRRLYVEKLAERLDLKASYIEAERRARGSRAGRGTREGPPVADPAASVRRMADTQVLQLLLHHPESATGLLDSDLRPILSEAVVVEIVETVMRLARNGAYSVDALLEQLESEHACGRVREILVHASVYSSREEVDQAVREIGGKAHRAGLSALLRSAKGDVRQLDELIQKMREGWCGRQGRRPISSGGTCR